MRGDGTRVTTDRTPAVKQRDIQKSFIKGKMTKDRLNSMKSMKSEIVLSKRVYATKNNLQFE